MTQLQNVSKCYLNYYLVSLLYERLRGKRADVVCSPDFGPGHRITSALPHGASFWTRTARINVDLAVGTSHSYFLKVARDAVGKGMCEAEYEGVAELYKVAPDFVPRPLGWGTYKADSNAHFYLAEFVDMIEEQPDMPKFCSALAKLHKDSMKLSNGLFGFHIVTYSGSMYQAVEWTASWEELWIKSIKTYAVQEREIHGPSNVLDKLLSVYYEKVCPRLLRPLQTGGRTIKPVLIHGDIWYGNIATKAENGEPITFDPSVFWAHNECE
jgi:protein-ribulosamine 3-kinase